MPGFDRRNESRAHTISMLKYIAAFAIFIVGPGLARAPLTPANIGSPAHAIQIQFGFDFGAPSVFQQAANSLSGTGQKPAGPCATAPVRKVHWDLDLASAEA
jgi:hypothetical protein